LAVDITQCVIAPDPTLLAFENGMFMDLVGNKLLVPQNCIRLDLHCVGMEILLASVRMLDVTVGAV